MAEERRQSELFSLAEDYVERHIELSPMMATRLGVPGHDDALDDFSPEHYAAWEELVRRTLSALERISPGDEVDRIGKSIMTERLERRLATLETKEAQRTFSVLWSPVSDVRRIFEMQPASTREEAEAARRRLLAVPGALESWRQSLESDAAGGQLNSSRQTSGVLAQLDTFAAGSFTAIASRLAGRAGVEDEQALVEAGRVADGACGELAAWMRQSYLPLCPSEDGVGRARYELWSQFYNGAELDLGELYEWGLEDLLATGERMEELARELVPRASCLLEAGAALDEEQGRSIDGTEALLARLRSITEGAAVMLDGRHFDIDPRVRFCDARIAPAGSAGAPYYTRPSEDLSRPGITWYPTLGRTRFPIWRVVSTWYHESIPGHHLQGGVSVLSVDRQSRFQRTEGFVSAYGEGWALYAERLMQELGALSDPADELGYLSKQAMRAARVVLDIGLHLHLPVPKALGRLGSLGDLSGRPWDSEMAVALLTERALVARDRALSEVDRYLGTPGQAIAYKAGERAFLSSREDARRRLGHRFDLKDWHAYALRLGPMGLSPFRDEMARYEGLARVGGTGRRP